MIKLAITGSKIYERKSYIIIKVNNGFIVYNTNKVFDNGHTHLHNYNMCKTLIDCSINKKFPKTRNHYLLESLIRISDDEVFCTKVRELIDTRNQKGKEKYFKTRKK